MIKRCCSSPGGRGAGTTYILINTKLRMLCLATNWRRQSDRTTCTGRSCKPTTFCVKFSHKSLDQLQQSAECGEERRGDIGGWAGLGREKGHMLCGFADWDRLGWSVGLVGQELQDWAVLRSWCAAAVVRLAGREYSTQQLQSCRLSFARLVALSGVTTGAL